MAELVTASDCYVICRNYNRKVVSSSLTGAVEDDPHHFCPLRRSRYIAPLCVTPSLNWELPTMFSSRLLNNLRSS